MNNNSMSKTLFVSMTLCLVCSLIISLTAVNLKDKQTANVLSDKQETVLASAGLLEEGKLIEESFLSIQEKIINLETGFYDNSIDLSTYDEKIFSRNELTSRKLLPQEDIAVLKRRENFAKVYLHYKDGLLSAVILPVRGLGLWGTLYGYLAMEPDLETVIGLEFYKHKETPGLGGEVDNPRWKSLWRGKKIYSPSGEVILSVIKGKVDNNSPTSTYQVDGLSGATITSNGVTNLLNFWLGELGYGPYLKNLKLNNLENIDV